MIEWIGYDFDPEESWEIETLELALGHGSGLYRIFVEFLAVTFSVIHSKLYMPVKGLFAILLSDIMFGLGLSLVSASGIRINAII